MLVLSVTKALNIVADVCSVLASLPDDSVIAVHVSHFFEHINNIQGLSSEITRVMLSSATLIVSVPHFCNPYCYSDPTHVRQFGLYLFCYLTRSHYPFRRLVPDYALNSSLALTSVSLQFQAPFRGGIRSLLAKILNILFNRSIFLQELYEGSFVYLLPCYTLTYNVSCIARINFQSIDSAKML
ncbi:hypothetical protein SynA15127_02351 [Synechococcus sp. A15-127]|nr:hypothetical protein SynA15127_02351 [Synechococcus sp. A15-127]